MSRGHETSPLTSWRRGAPATPPVVARGGRARIDADGGHASPLISQLLDLIKSAQARVWLKVPWWDARVPEAKQVLEAVLNAKRRGVDARVILRPDRECEAADRAAGPSGDGASPA